MNIIYFVKEILLISFIICTQILICTTYIIYFNNNIVQTACDDADQHRHRLSIGTAYNRHHGNNHMQFTEWYTKKFTHNVYIEPYTVESIYYKIIVYQVSLLGVISILAYGFLLLKPFIKKKTIFFFIVVISCIVELQLIYTYVPVIWSSGFVFKKEKIENMYYSYEYLIDRYLYTQIKAGIMLTLLIIHTQYKTKLFIRIVIFFIVIFCFSFDLFTLCYFIVLIELVLLIINIHRHWR